mgnify:CR=1 FL=1
MGRGGGCGGRGARGVRTFAETGFRAGVRVARLFVSDKRELEQWGSERIRRGLLARGVDREMAERALLPGAGGMGTTGEGKPGQGGGRIMAAGDPRVHEAAIRLLKG